MCSLNLQFDQLDLLTQNLLVVKDAASQTTRASPAKNNNSVLHVVGPAVERALNNSNHHAALLKIPQQKKANMVEFWLSGVIALPQH